MPDRPTYSSIRLGVVRLLIFLLPFSIEVPVINGSLLRIPTEPLIGMIALLFIFDILRNPLPFKRLLRVELVWLTPLIVAFAVSMLFSSMPFVSLKFALVNMMYMLLFYLFFTQVFVRHPALFAQLLFIYGMGLLVVLLWAMFQYWQWAWNPVVVRGIFRPFYNDHTIFGASAAMLAVFWITRAVLIQDRFRRIFFSVMGLVFVAAVIFSTSRAAFLSLLFSAAVFFLLLVRVRPLYLLGLCALIGIGILVFNNQLTDRIRRVDTVSYDHQAGFIERTGSVANITSDDSNVERINRWVSAVRMFKERPLTGFGPGTYQFEYIPFQEPALMNKLTVTNIWHVPEGSGGTAHSEYLLALSEMGILGLLGWLVIMGRWLWLAWICNGRSPLTHTNIIAITTLSTYMFHAFFNNFMTTDKFAFLFWGTAAWLVAGNYIEDDKGFLSES